MIRTRAVAIALCMASLAAAQEPPAGTKIVHPVDGAVMVWVPSGPFTMGMNREDADQVARDLGYKSYEDLWAWETFPRRTVHVAGFFIDQTEVTVERWRKFAAAHPDDAVTREATNTSDKPEDQNRAAGGITWAQAQRYANWAGKALPTEAQWEKAARGEDGRLYPWGNQSPNDSRLKMTLDRTRPLQPGLVGQHQAGASPYGVLDMLGNQYEWTSEWAEPYPNNPEASRMFSYTGHRNGCLRGGSVYHGRISFYAAKRMGLPPDETHFHIGFRTVWEPPADYFASPEFERDRRAAEQLSQ